VNGPLVSIIMSAHNSERTIGATILSLINQSYWNWELVVIDDASTDRTVDEIKFFKEKRIKLFRRDQNRGLPAGLNLAISRAAGRFLARMDSDDYMETYRLADQVKTILLEGVAVCGTGAEKFGAEGGRIVSPKTGHDIINTFLVSNPFVHPTVMFDIHRIEGGPKYDETFVCEEDYELWSRLLTTSNCYNIDYPTIKYRTSANSNANRPQKKRLNIKCLRQFADRFGIGDIAPLDDLTEFQLSGYIDEPGYRRLADYAAVADKNSLPKLGWIHGPLLEHTTYQDFYSWLNDVRRYTPFNY